MAAGAAIALRKATPQVRVAHGESRRADAGILVELHLISRIDACSDQQKQNENQMDRARTEAGWPGNAHALQVILRVEGGTLSWSGARCGACALEAKKEPLRHRPFRQGST